MTPKELKEIRRRVKPDNSAFTHIHGCYVNGNKEIVAYLDESLASLPKDEAALYFTLLKKSLSGKQGRNLIDIVFSTAQVADSDEYRMLMGLRDCALADHKKREDFYHTVIDALEMQTDYLILLSYEAYDVPYQSGAGTHLPDAGDSVFRYILCSICPVKDGKQELGYFAGDNEFHNRSLARVVESPELGFLFPAFDDRSANIYNALFYAKKPDEIHHEFIAGVFHVDPPMTPSEQRDAFRAALATAEIHSMAVIQGLHEQLRAAIDENTDALQVGVSELTTILVDCGVDEKQIKAFQKSYNESFGAGVVVSPENLIDSGKFTIKSGEATLDVEPTHSYMVESRMIDGRKYLMIPVDVDTEINGFEVNV